MIRRESGIEKGGNLKRRTFGQTDLEVSTLCLGTMQFGWTTDEASSFAVMDAFVEAGGNFIDSADIYSRWAEGNEGGVSEEIIGRWIKERGNRNRVVVATKARGRMWDGPDGEGLHRAHLERAVEDSLRRLQTDTIDLYQCHWPDENVPIDQTLEVFSELIESGKVRYVGASNYDAPKLEAALRTANGKQRARFVSLQPHYNLVHRSEFETDLEDVCGRERLAVIPYSPLASGFLSGKYRPDEAPPKSQRSHAVRKYMDEKGFGVLREVERAAQAHGTAVPAIALAWLLANDTVTAPIIGANTVQQLGDLLPAAQLELTEEQKGVLDAASSGY